MRARSEIAVELSIKDERGFNQGFAFVGSTPTRMLRRNDWLVAQATRAKARRILELGCGTGETAAHIATHMQAEVVAVDISRLFVEQARARFPRPNLRFETFDLLGAKAPSFGAFDFVCGNGILHHLVNRLPDVLASLHRLTNSCGGLAFIEPNLLNPYCAAIFGTRLGRKLANLEPDEMAFTPGQLRAALPAAGWTNVEVRTRDFLVPGLPQWTIGPIRTVEPALEAMRATRWLAQSHFVTATA